MTATGAEQKAVRATTSYVVLKRADGPESEKTWREIRALGATTARDAVRQVAAETPGTYIAVPARSMVPVTVKVEKQTVVKLS